MVIIQGEMHPGNIWARVKKESGGGDLCMKRNACRLLSKAQLWAGLEPQQCQCQGEQRHSTHLVVIRGAASWKGGLRHVRLEGVSRRRNRGGAQGEPAQSLGEASVLCLVAPGVPQTGRLNKGGPSQLWVKKAKIKVSLAPVPLRSLSAACRKPSPLYACLYPNLLLLLGHLVMSQPRWPHFTSFTSSRTPSPVIVSGTRS